MLNIDLKELLSDRLIIIRQRYIVNKSKYKIFF